MSTVQYIIIIHVVRVIHMVIQNRYLCFGTAGEHLNLDCLEHRGCIHRQHITRKTNSAFRYSQLRICLFFGPSLCFPKPLLIMYLLLLTSLPRVFHSQLAHKVLSGRYFELLCSAPDLEYVRLSIRGLASLAEWDESLRICIRKLSDYQISDFQLSEPEQIIDECTTLLVLSLYFLHEFSCCYRRPSLLLFTSVMFLLSLKLL